MNFDSAADEPEIGPNTALLAALRSVEQKQGGGMSSAAPPKKRTPAQIVVALRGRHTVEKWVGTLRCGCCLRPWPCDTIRIINGEATL